MTNGILVFEDMRVGATLPQIRIPKRRGCWRRSADVSRSSGPLMIEMRIPRPCRPAQDRGVRNSQVAFLDFERGSSNVASGSLSASARATYHAS